MIKTLKNQTKQKQSNKTSLWFFSQNLNFGKAAKKKIQ